MKTVLLFSTAFLLCISVYGQNGYQYLDFSAGVSTRNFEVAEISYEWQGRYHKGNEFFFQYGRTDRDFIQVVDSLAIDPMAMDTTLFFQRTRQLQNFLAGYAYKPLITRKKNLALNLRLAGAVGTNEDKFLASLSAGFELSYTLPNAFVLMIRQRNQVVFWAREPWRVGAFVGLKIPLIKIN